MAHEDLGDDAFLVPVLDLIGFAPSRRWNFCESPRAMDRANMFVDCGCEARVSGRDERVRG